MSAKPFGQLHQKLEERPGGLQALERARKNLDAEIAAYEAGLAELRRALDLTQDQLARQLEVSQSEVSRLERRADLYLSTLQSYIEAMGGELELVGVFDDARVKLSIGDLVRSKPDEIDEGEIVESRQPPTRSWDVSAILEYRGAIGDEPIEDVRTAIVASRWTGDSAAIQRGYYSDQVDVNFEISATTEDDARKRVSELIARALRRVSDVRIASRGVPTIELTDRVR